MRGELQQQRRGKDLNVPPDDAGERITAAWERTNGNDSDHIASLVDEVCGDVSLWGIDLRSVDGFTGEVAVSLSSLIEKGVQAALADFLGSQAGARRVTV